jgi:hypothetical protein
MNWRLVLAAAAAPVLLQSGCVVVPMGNLPGPGYVDDQTLTSLKSKKLTRADTLMTLGDPDDRYLGDRAFGYRWTESVAAVVFAAGYQAAGFEIKETRRLMIEFGAGGALVRADVLGAINQKTLGEAVEAWLAQVATSGQ